MNDRLADDGTDEEIAELALKDTRRGTLGVPLGRWCSFACYQSSHMSRNSFRKSFRSTHRGRIFSGYRLKLSSAP